MAAIQLGSYLGTDYTQDFNSLTNATWANDSTIPGWYASSTNSPIITSIPLSNGSTATGSLYSFGTTVGDTDRALGSIGSSAIGDVKWGVRLVNDTGNTITGLTIGYTGEQWRDANGSGQIVDFDYQIGASNLTTGSWTAFNALDFASPVNTNGNGTALNGNLAANQTVFIPTTLDLSLAPGEEVWLRWSDVNHSGNDHGLAIDNFSVRAVQTQRIPEPSDLMGTTLAVCAIAILKRKLSSKKSQL
jgi:serralysin